MEYQRSPSKTMNLSKPRSCPKTSRLRDEESVGGAAEVSSNFRNPHHYRTEEALCSLNLVDDEDHNKERRFRTSDSRYPRDRSSICLRSMQENADQFRLRRQGIEKFEDDYELEKRAIAAEEKAYYLSKGLEQMAPCRLGSTTKGDATVYLQNKLRKLYEDKRNLYLEFASEIRARLSDRSAANEALKMLKNEIQMANKDKNSVQVNLENELDRRSGEWKTSMDKIKLENKRLRDRVRDLAEQNVASQREATHLNTVVRVLKEKLNSKEDDAAHLQEQVERAVQNEEVWKTEIKRMQHLVDIASHKAMEFEFELRDKNERIRRLEDELRLRLNETPLLRDDLNKVAKERDLMRQRLERSDRENVRLNKELEACERKLEKLDEDLLMKDGQICILRASHEESFSHRD